MAAIRRFPLLKHAGIQLFFNGPESFTPDGNALMGETPELRNLFVACGLNTVGVMSGGAMGKMIAEWIRDRRRPEGFAEFDVARISGFQSGRAVEAPGVLYDVGWPNREYISCRGGAGGRCTTAMSRRMRSWETVRVGRCLVYAPSAETAVLQPSYGCRNWMPWAASEVRTVEETLALFDESAAAKLRITGHEAVAALHVLSGERPEVPPPQS